MNSLGDYFFMMKAWQLFLWLIMIMHKPSTPDKLPMPFFWNIPLLPFCLQGVLTPHPLYILPCDNPTSISLSKSHSPQEDIFDHQMKKQSCFLLFPMYFIVPVLNTDLIIQGNIIYSQTLNIPKGLSCVF